jgi:uncharacterized protein YbjT (DUF2867 family)
MIYELSGPEVLTGEEVAAVFGSVLGQEVLFREMSVEQMAKFMPIEFAQMRKHTVEDKSLVPFSNHVAQITGQSGTTFLNFVRSHLEYFD